MVHLQKWSTNESLLQSYRQIFISSQSFFLAIAAILIENADELTIICLAFIGLLMIWFIWFRVVRSRHLAVDYHKYIDEFIKNNDGEYPKGICTEKKYIEIFSKERKKTNKVLGIEKNLRLTRKKIDVYLPILFTLTWVLLIHHKLNT